MKSLKTGLLFLSLSSIFTLSNGQTCGNNCGRNLIKNGDFEEGLKYFTTDLVLDETDNLKDCGGQYLIDNSSIPYSGKDNNGSTWTVGADHTTGSGLFYIGDPPCLSDGAVVYRSAEIFLEVGETYNFSAWASNLNPTNNFPLIILTVKMPISGNTQDIAAFTVTYDEENPWMQICGQFTATSSEAHRFLIEIGPSADIVDGGDFGLDDVSLYKNVMEGGNNSGTLTTSACDSFVFPSGNQTVFASGDYSDTLTNAAGCDSILSISLTVLETTFSNLEIEGCDSVTAPSGRVFYVSGNFNDTIQNGAGCDSIITIDITLDNPSSTQTMTVCDSFISPLLNVYKETGSYIENHTSSQGCNSVVTFDLTVNHTSTAELTATSCQNYISPSGKEFNKSGVYLDTIPNAANCDSIITIDFTREVKLNEIVAEACDSFESEKGIVYKSSGEFEEFFTTAEGCDSVLTLILSINKSTTEELVITSCDDYTSDKGNTYTESGTYTEVFTTSKGCDSTVNLQLTINSITAAATREEIELTANLAGQTYQWLDCIDGFSEISGEINQTFTPKNDGEYAVKITSTKGCVDTSACLWVILLSVENPLENEIKIYPNPSSGALTFEIKKDGEYVGEIYSLSGKLLKSFNVSDQENHVNFSSLASGVYLISLSDKTGVILREKVVLVR
jgi:hypothetical protein